VLTEFPLAFQELAQLQREDPTFAGIVAQLEKGDMVDGYILSKRILYCRPKKRGDPKLVVPHSGDTDGFRLFSWVAAGRASRGL